LKHLSRLDNLKTLDLHSTQVRGPGLESIARLALQSLNLDDTPIDDAGLVYLSGAEELGSLSLARTAVTDEGLKQLLRLRKIDHIDLAGTKVTGSGLRYLVHLPELDSVRLAGCPVDCATLTVLKSLNPPHGFGIWLDLNETNIDDAAMAHVGKLRNVQRLFLNHTKITDAGLAHLHGLPKLKAVEAIGTAITEQGIAALKAATPSLQGVETKPEEE
jgi:hypothetical protein